MTKIFILFFGFFLLVISETWAVIEDEKLSQTIESKINEGYSRDELENELFEKNVLFEEIEIDENEAEDY